MIERRGFLACAVLVTILCESVFATTPCQNFSTFNNDCLAPLRRRLSSLEIEEECEVLVWGIPAKVFSDEELAECHGRAAWILSLLLRGLNFIGYHTRRESPTNIF